MCWKVNYSLIIIVAVARSGIGDLARFQKVTDEWLVGHHRVHDELWPLKSPVIILGVEGKTDRETEQHCPA